jgi:hypothetical protein
MTASGWAVSPASCSGIGAVFGNLGSRDHLSVWRGFIDSCRSSLAEVLDRLPDPRHGGRSIFEFTHRRFTWQAVPDFDQSGRWPVGSQLRQRCFIAKMFGIRNGFGFLRRAVNGDVVGFVFNREVLHFQSPGAVITAVITHITPVGNECKRIVKDSDETSASVGRMVVIGSKW